MCCRAERGSGDNGDGEDDGDVSIGVGVGVGVGFVQVEPKIGSLPLPASNSSACYGWFG